MKVTRDPSRKSSYQGITIIAALCVLVLGCATVSPQQRERVNLSIERTRVTLEKANADAKIATSAAVPLFEAEQTLRQAEQAEDFALKEHLAYMAERKAQLAVAIADRNIAENETLALAKEKDELLLKVREQQAKTAEADAERQAAEAASAKAEAEKARTEATQAEKALAELKAEKTERGMVLTLGDVLFATGEATLSPGAMMTIERLAAFMEKYPKRGVVIEGHTDNVGRAEYNMVLSSRRADAVKKALVEKGIAADRIATIGYGETYLKASNDSAAGRQQNRRVEVVILDEGVNPNTYKR